MRTSLFLWPLVWPLGSVAHRQPPCLRGPLDGTVRRAVDPDVWMLWRERSIGRTQRGDGNRNRVPPAAAPAPAVAGRPGQRCNPQ